MTINFRKHTCLNQGSNQDELLLLCKGIIHYKYVASQLSIKHSVFKFGKICDRIFIKEPNPFLNKWILHITTKHFPSQYF